MESRTGGPTDLKGDASEGLDEEMERLTENQRGLRLREVFKAGNAIELFDYSPSLGAGETNGGESKRAKEPLLRFSILEHLGVGSFGIVVSAKWSRAEGVGRNSNLDVEEDAVGWLEERRGSLRAQVSGFEIRSLIRSGLGAVGGEARGSESVVAIKIMNLEECDSLNGEDPVLLAKRETMIMSELQDCSEVLRYYFTFTSGSFLFIVMEYCKGGSLYGIYNKCGSFPEELIALVMTDVLRALKRLHSASKSECIIHNDIKSANILVSESCKAKLADFGVSRKIHVDARENKVRNDTLYETSGYREQEMLGSPFWLAPEVIIGQNCHRAADIWSLGITVLELAFGRIPWPTFSKLENLLSHIIRSPPPHKSVREDVRRLFSPEFWDFVDSCLQKDPRKRKSAEVLLEHPFLQNSCLGCPASLEEFLDIASGKKRMCNRANRGSNKVVRGVHVEGIFSYLNDMFPIDKSAPPPSGNVLGAERRKSISLSRYFSRKKSGNNNNNARKNLVFEGSHPEDREDASEDSGPSAKTSGSKIRPLSSCSLLERRISAKFVQECLCVSLPNAVAVHAGVLSEAANETSGEQVLVNQMASCNEAMPQKSGVREGTEHGESNTEQDYSGARKALKKKPARYSPFRCTCIGAVRGARNRERGGFSDISRYVCSQKCE